MIAFDAPGSAAAFAIAAVPYLKLASALLFGLGVGILVAR